MRVLRIENHREGQWMLRGEGPIPDTVTADLIKESVDRVALNHSARALVDGVVTYETKKISAKRARALFGI